MKSWKEFKETLKTWLEKESNHNKIVFEYQEHEGAFSNQVTIKAIAEDKGKARMTFKKSKYESMSTLTDIEICSYITQVLKDHFRTNSQRKYFIPRDWFDNNNR